MVILWPHNDKKVEDEKGDMMLTASVAKWLRAWDTLTMFSYGVREVVSSIPDRGNIVG